VRTVSPGGKALVPVTTMQNCTPDSGETKPALPKTLIVHAPRGLVATLKVQPKSLSASVTRCVREKSGMSKPGMPSSVQTCGFPSPRALEASICKSGRTEGSSDFVLKTTVPTCAPAVPGMASTTSWNPDPAPRWNRGAPSASMPTDEMTLPSAAARPRNVISGPAGIGVAVGLTGGTRYCRSASISAESTTPFPFTSAPGQSLLGFESAAVPLPKSSAVSAVTSCASTVPSQFTSPGSTA
jgi:hypothetical protein